MPTIVLSIVLIKKNIIFKKKTTIQIIVYLRLSIFIEYKKK